MFLSRDSSRAQRVKLTDRKNNRLEELSKTRTEDRTLKTLVFSQFTTML